MLVTQPSGSGKPRDINTMTCGASVVAYAKAGRGKSCAMANHPPHPPGVLTLLMLYNVNTAHGKNVKQSIHS